MIAAHMVTFIAKYLYKKKNEKKVIK